MARRSLTVAALIAALIFIAASCVLNFVFWQSQGKTEHEGYILGAVSVAADILKATLPIFIGWAIARRRWIYAIGATPFFLLFVVAGLVASLGFVAGNRAETIGGREASAAQFAQASADLAAIDSRLSRLTGYPPIAALEAELAKIEQSPRFASSDRCTNATAPASRDVCAAYFDTKAKLGVAIEANRLSSKREAVSAEVSRLRAAGAATEADPQAGIFARWLPGNLAPTTIRDALAMFFAVLVELGAAFGLFLATRHGELEARKSHDDNRLTSNDRRLRIAAANDRQASENAYENRLTSTVSATPVSVVIEPRRFVGHRRWIEGEGIEVNQLAAKG